MVEEPTNALWRVLIVEDDAMLASLLARAIQREDDLALLGIASSLAEANKLIITAPPELVLLDLSLGRGPDAESGWRLLETWPAALPKPHWIVVTGQPETAHLRRALDLELGGYVTKSEPFETLLAALREVREGRQYYSSGALRLLVEKPAAAPGLAQLTPRERDVLRAAGDGLSVRQTAARLGLSENTVKTHRKSLMAKLDLHDAVAVARYALAAGLSVGHG
ncbi:MAG: response regulator transcription factor [Opitutaceae bacterium]